MSRRTWQIEYHRDGQSHLFPVADETLAMEWLNDLVALAPISWVVVYRKEFGSRTVHAVKDKTGKCPVKGAQP